MQKATPDRHSRSILPLQFIFRWAGIHMILALSAVLLFTVLFLILLSRMRGLHPDAEYQRSAYLSSDRLSTALREVCQVVLTPKTLIFLTANAPTPVIESFGKQQQQLARYSLRVASTALVATLTNRNEIHQVSFRADSYSRIRNFFILVVCLVGRLGLVVLSSLNWGISQSVQSWFSSKIVSSLGSLLTESSSMSENIRVSPLQADFGHKILVSDEPLRESPLCKQINEALLKALPNELSRMIYVATLRDNNSGHYFHPELTRKFSMDTADRAMLACHGQLFERVVQLSLEDLTDALDVYIASMSVPKVRVIENWKKLRAYRATIPIDSDPISAEIFFMKVEVAVAVLEARLPYDSKTLEWSA